MPPAPDLAALAADAYVYGYPLVADLTEVRRFTATGMGTLPAAPFNAFAHAAQLAGPADTFVTVNNDTVYSAAQVDLGSGPQVLHVPDTAGRYYVLQFVDAWTNNFAYVGRRATGTGEGSFLLAPPDWAGETPAGLRRITAPTRVFSIVGRNACAGPDDLPAVRALQAQLTLRPLDPAAGPPAGLPEPDTGVAEDLRFWEQLRVGMGAFPPAPADIAYQQRFAPLGLLSETSPYVAPDATLATALRAGFAAGRDAVEALTRHQPSTENGWSLTLHAFDYNLDHFELGALAEPRWRLPDRAAVPAARAAAARAGLWGNHAYEALYALTFVDGDGQQLTGARRYRIRFPQPPPVDAFWSLTMYDLPNYYLVANPIGRYSIGDRTPGLRPDPDGGFTLFLQHEAPPAGQEPNWLPTPAGDFRPVMRMYQPGAALLDGTYRLPPIERVD